jgi:hypothetical protein
MINTDDLITNSMPESLTWSCASGQPSLQVPAIQDSAKNKTNIALNFGLDFTFEKLLLNQLNIKMSSCLRIRFRNRVRSVGGDSTAAEFPDQISYFFERFI